MESASVPGTPAVAEQPVQPTEPTAPAAAEAPPAQSPTQPAPQQPVTPEEPKPEPTLSDVMTQVQSMRDEFDSIKGGGQQAAAAPEGGLMDHLLGPEEPAEPGAGDQGAEQQPGQGEQGPEGGFDPNDPAFKEFQQYLQSEIQNGIRPFAEERQEEQLVALEKRYPDILDEKVFPRVEQALDEGVRRSGNPALKLDPYMIELAYKAVKAEAADAVGVPAEQAATDGASIGTGAGQSQAGQPSQAEQYVQNVYGQSRPKSVYE